MDAGESQNEKRQITEVTSIALNHGWEPTRFTARENLQDRNLILDAFKNKSIKSLVAIKCLDEGVDIPSCETAFLLASSSNPRQFIQRRGRILRRSPGKEKAIIYDFFVHTNGGVNDKFNRRLIKKEVKRVREFSSFALNKHQAYVSLEPILTIYGLSHLV